MIRLPDEMLHAIPPYPHPVKPPERPKQSLWDWLFRPKESFKARIA